MLELRTLSDVRTGLSARIASLDATDYRQGLTESWHELARPYDLGDAPESLAHLGFALLVRATPPGGVERQARGRVLDLAPQIDIMWSYRLRHDAQQADFWLASDAAVDLAGAVFDTKSWAGGAVNVELIDLFQPLIDPEELWLHVTSSFRLHLNIEV